MVLTDYLIKRARAQAIGQRRIFARSIVRCGGGKAIGKQVGYWSTDIVFSSGFCMTLLREVNKIYRRHILQETRYD